MAIVPPGCAGNGRFSFVVVGRNLGPTGDPARRVSSLLASECFHAPSHDSRRHRHFLRCCLGRFGICKPGSSGSSRSPQGPRRQAHRARTPKERVASSEAGSIVDHAQVQARGRESRRMLTGDPGTVCRGFRRPRRLSIGHTRGMNPVTRTWLDGLRERAAEHRPATGEEVSAHEIAAERMILAAQLSSWLTGFDDCLASRRAWLAEASPEGDRDPAIVVTTSPVGMTVADELTATGSLPARSLARELVAVTERTYRLWCIAHPDPKHLQHVNVWNWIKKKVPEQRHLEFARHPLQPGEAYWLHRAGIAGAGSADRRDCHLWKWTGRHAVLLEAFITERNVGRLGAAESD